MAIREVSKYNPFSKRKTIGPGPRGQKNHEAKRWACRCEQVSPDESKCVCEGLRTPRGAPSRARKAFSINLRKKRAYAKTWRAWKKRHETGT